MNPFTNSHHMGYESDEQIASRKLREREVEAAWRKFRATSPRGVRRRLANLPAANPEPKAIVVARAPAGSPDQPKALWKSWKVPRRPV